MNENTQKLTFGALLVAVFGVLLLLNRQTGAMLEESFLFLFPIPMVAFSARYGFRDSLPVFFCTILISVFCGIFTSAFYAGTQSFIGMVYGSCLHAKRDMTKTMLLIMALSAVSNVLSSVVLASLFGINIQEDIAFMQTTITEAFAKAGAVQTQAQQEAIALLLQPDALLRMFIISMIFMGIVQGFIVCQLSVLILRRLRFPIRRPDPVTSYYPPRWTGILALVLFIGYGRAVAMPQTTGREEFMRVAVQSGGLCGYMYLLAFGFIALLLLLRAFGPKSRAVNVILAVILFFILPQIVMLLGAAYISLGLHEWVQKKMEDRIAREGGKVRR
ncbi:MAG: DUF2232 domain-containing protein [Eubacteriales bacterium]|nr:DUF2232 domain-containing protein [Eubacteriales bacterium]